MIEILWKTAQQFHIKLNMYLLYDPEMSLLGVSSSPPSKKTHESIPRLVMKIHTSFIHNKRTLETTQIPQMVMEKHAGWLCLYNRLLLRKRKELLT